MDLSVRISCRVLRAGMLGVLLLLHMQVQQLRSQEAVVMSVDEVRVLSTTGSVAARTADGKTVAITVAKAAGGEASITAVQKAGSTLATAAGSSAVVALPAAGAFLMAPNTQVKLPKPEEKGHTLELLKGQLFFDISAEELQKRGGATFRLKTPAALLAVKGTRFFASSINALDTAGVHQGRVDVSDTSAQQLVSLSAGKAVPIQPGQLGQPRALAASEQAYARNYDLIMSSAGNSLGMKFVPVPGTKILMCIHETRRADYAAYAAENPGINRIWEDADVDGVALPTAADYPVPDISWDSAQAFCQWLSKREGRSYRLPTDREWSVAVGIGDQEAKDATPDALSLKLRDVYPWGTQWPPPAGTGNFPDSAWHEKFPTREYIADYTDGFALTAPVMSFKPNKLGIYDLDGNLREWIENSGTVKEKSYHALRGASFYPNISNKTMPEVLMSSYRYFSANLPGPEYGFRIVLVLP